MGLQLRRPSHLWQSKAKDDAV